MTPTAAAILGYIFGLVTALLIGAVWALVRGGSDLRDDDRQQAERIRHRNGDWS